jgi:D-tyrosyl-tRNA(Tyr) deacylase
MRAVVQRVTGAYVTVGGEIIGEIGHGLVALVAVAPTDTEREAAWLAAKLVDVRVFADAGGTFARSVRDMAGAILVVSQFTLYADTRKGRRPSFSGAAEPEQAERLYRSVMRHIEGRGVPVCGGRFGAHMEVKLVNDGPVTLILDSPAVRSVDRRHGEDAGTP